MIKELTEKADAVRSKGKQVVILVQRLYVFSDSGIFRGRN
jgi:hypothetical protein